MLSIAASPLVAAEDTSELPAIDPQTNPYNVRNGKVDFGTYNGFRRYSASCGRCHGPSGNGSSFAPALKNAVKDLGYPDFVNIVVNGRNLDASDSNRVMPAFGENPNVMNHINDIWGYLNARADGAVGPGRPERMR